MKFFTEKYYNSAADCLAKAGKLGATAASLGMAYSDGYHCVYEAGRLKTSSTSERWHYALEVVVNGHRGAAAGNSLEHLNELLERAVALAKIGAVSHYTTLPAVGKYADIKSYSPELEKLTREKLICDCGGMVDALKADDGNIDISSAGSREYQESFVMNSAGLFHKEQNSDWGLELGFVKVEGQDMLFAGENRHWRALNDLYDTDYLVAQNRFDYQHGSHLSAIGSGSFPVVLSPDVFSSFLSPVMAGLNGRDVYKGISPLKEKLGKKCFSDDLTIRDEPHLDFAPWSVCMDDNGIPTKSMALIQNGVVERFLYDYDTACMVQTEPTGHEGCSPYAPRVTPGKTSSRDIIGSIKRGLFIKSLLGFGQGNIGNGDFSCNIALGYLIENGKVTGRVKNTMIAGNIFELLKNLQVSSDIDLNSLYPYAMLDGVQVAVKG